MSSGSKSDQSVSSGLPRCSHYVDEIQTEHGGYGEGFCLATIPILIRFRVIRDSGGVRISERWYLDHMGVMAFWRTVIGMANLSLTVLVVLRVFEFL